MFERPGRGLPGRGTVGLGSVLTDMSPLKLQLLVQGRLTVENQ